MTLTDFDDAVLTACEKNMRVNAETVGGSGSQCLKLDWDDVPASLPELLGENTKNFVPFDVLLGADVCYDLEHPAKLLKAISVLGQNGLLAEGASVCILNGWPNRGLRRFEQLVGAHKLLVNRAPESPPKACEGYSEALPTPHARKFLEMEVDCESADDVDMGGLELKHVNEIDGQDERGAPCQFRLYVLEWRCASIDHHQVEQGVRARAISLRRCAERWTACETHMQENLPQWLDFGMAEGVDGSLYKKLLLESDGTPSEDGPSDEQIKAVETAMGCKLYRGWPVCETGDVLRVLEQTQNNNPGLVSDPATEEGSDSGAEESIDISALSETRAWDIYRSWFSDWARRRAWPYIDFHCRHITLGEVGAALSHVRLIDEAVREGVRTHIFFEDDARPRPGALTKLFAEIERLKQHGFEWDLIYIRASLYSVVPEEPLSDRVPGSCLFWARHRKVTDAYCLSQRGMQRIANSGLRDCLFAFDDFLPSLHSQHPRRDVMQLPCVVKGRCDGEGGFIGLSFGDDVLSDSAYVGSETNLSPCILGDHGSCAELC